MVGIRWFVDAWLELDALAEEKIKEILQFFYIFFEWKKKYWTENLCQSPFDLDFIQFDFDSK